MYKIVFGTVVLVGIALLWSHPAIAGVFLGFCIGLVVGGEK